MLIMRTITIRWNLTITRSKKMFWQSNNIAFTLFSTSFRKILLCSSYLVISWRCHVMQLTVMASSDLQATSRILRTYTLWVVFNFVFWYSSWRNIQLSEHEFACKNTKAVQTIHHADFVRILLSIARNVGKLIWYSQQERKKLFFISNHLKIYRFFKPRYNLNHSLDQKAKIRSWFYYLKRRMGR